MSSKKMNVFVNQKSLDFLHIIAGSPKNDAALGISEAINLAINMAAFCSFDLLPISENELLFCCDILNPGAQMTEFKDHENVNIRQSIDSMKFGLHDALKIETGIIEKWSVDKSNLHSKLELMTQSELMTLAVATRIFWAKKSFGDLKPLGACENYQQWAQQFVKQSCQTI